jgi:hypothetical protein
MLWRQLWYYMSVVDTHLAHALAYRIVVGQGKFDQTVETETF